MGVGRALAAIAAVFVLAVPVAYAVTDLRVPGIPQDVTSAASIANYETALHSNYMEWARKIAIFCGSGTALWVNRDRDYTCYDWLASVYKLPKNFLYATARPEERAYVVPMGPRDEVKAYTTAAWELMQRQAMGWKPSGPRDEVMASSQAALALMQKTSPPSGPRDLAKATQLSNWELMQRQAMGWKPSGPRDENAKGQLYGPDVAQKLAEASLRNELLYGPKAAPKAAETPAPMREERPSYSSY